MGLHILLGPGVAFRGGMSSRLDRYSSEEFRMVTVQRWVIVWWADATLLWPMLHQGSVV